MAEGENEVTSKRGMSINVARAMGFMPAKPPEIEITLPCPPNIPQSYVFYKDGLSSKDLYLAHRECVQQEFRL